MRTTQIATVTAAQAAVLLAAATSDLGRWWSLVVSLHLLVAILGVVVLAAPAHAALFLVGLYVAWGADFAVSASADEPLVTIAFAAASLTVPIPIVLAPGLRPVLASLVVGSILCVSVLLMHPGWGSDLAAALATSIVGMCVVAIVLINGLRSFARRADRLSQDVEIERRRTVSIRAASTAAAEIARVLHDTVINTLGAVARVTTLDGRLVRRRCRQDVERVEALLGTGIDTAAPKWLADFYVPDASAVRRVGLSTSELQRYEALMSDEVARALHGCAQEAVANAVKHSRADRVDVHVRRDGHDLVVEVADDGIGFDGAIPPGRGLAESVFARADDHGIRVTLHTVAGQGTRVSLRYALKGAAVDRRPAHLRVDETVDGMRRRACWTWCAIIVATGLAIEAVRRPGRLTLTQAVLAAVGVLGLLCWLTSRGNRRLPHWLAWTVVVSGPALVVVALAAVEFGRREGFFFQPAGVTPLYAILLLVAPTRRLIAAGFGFLMVVLAIVTVVAGSSLSDAVIVAMLAAAMIVLLGAWYIFDRQFGVIGSELAKLARDAYDARLERATAELSRVARSRFNAQGLQESLTLLRSIADGSLDPHDDEVRRRCDSGERYLRQVTALSPDSTMMSWWFALALTEAQSKSVRMWVHAGSIELHDERAAESFGRVVLTCLEGTPSGSDINVSLLDHDGGPRLFIVGDRRLHVGPALVQAAPESCEIQHQHLGAETLVEAIWRQP